LRPLTSHPQSHCKLRWDTEEDRLEWSDYYDFSASYDDFDAADQGWEDTDEMVEDDGEAIELDLKGRPVGLPPPPPAVRYGDTEYELVLPSGKRIGHRALRHIYKQNLVCVRSPYTLCVSREQPHRPYMNGDSKQTRAARRLANLDEKRSGADNALVPIAGGSGAFGKGQQVVRARNKGEAKHAQKATRDFAEVKARQAHMTRIATYSGNDQVRPFVSSRHDQSSEPAGQQKHFRDPLLVRRVSINVAPSSRLTSRAAMMDLQGPLLAASASHSACTHSHAVCRPIDNTSTLQRQRRAPARSPTLDRRRRRPVLLVRPAPQPRPLDREAVDVDLGVDRPRLTLPPGLAGLGDPAQGRRALVVGRVLELGRLRRGGGSPIGGGSERDGGGVDGGAKEVGVQVVELVKVGREGEVVDPGHGLCMRASVGHIQGPSAART
jgi:hypothetical protein